MAHTVAALSSVSLSLASPVFPSGKAGDKLGLGLPKSLSVRPSRAVSRTLSVVASAKKTDSDEVSQAVVASSLAGSLFAMMANAGSAAAAEEVMQIAEGDARGFLLLFVLLPALGWVAFNVFKPALNQINKMTGAKSVAGAVGLGAMASLLSAPDADAAQEVAQLAIDNRPLILAFILLPALGWVLFNVFKPTLNQINKMIGKDVGSKKRGIAGVIGFGAASLLAAESADAAQEVAQLAVDNRPFILAFVLLPALGWVLFNVFKPTLNQINKMTGSGAPPPKRK